MGKIREALSTIEDSPFTDVWMQHDKISVKTDGHTATVNSYVRIFGESPKIL